MDPTDPTSSLNVDLMRVRGRVVPVSDGDVRLAVETLWTELEAGCISAGSRARAAVLSSKIAHAADDSMAVVISETGLDGGASAAPHVGFG